MFLFTKLSTRLFAVIVLSIGAIGLIGWRGILVFEDIRQISNDIVELSRTINKPDKQFSDWKTYRNYEYGFEVEYPGDWHWVEDDNLIYLVDNTEIGHKILDIYIEDRKDKGLTEWIKERGYKKVKDIKIDDINGVIIDFSFVEESGPFTAAIFPKENKMFRIGFSSTSVETFEKILSTFKFIE